MKKNTDDIISKASCIEGKGACPPEDCGEVWGYEEMKNILASEPDSDEANDFRDWLGLEKMKHGIQMRLIWQKQIKT